MKKIFFILLLILVIGCGAEKYGSGVDKTVQKVSVKDVFINTTYQGKIVNLEGVITTQCASNGCWFFLKDDTGQIFVDLATKGFALPQRQGKKAIVTGTVSFGQNGVFIIAHGVELK